MRLAALSNEDLESLGKGGRRDLLATLFVNAETARHLGRLERVLDHDINAAQQQAAAAALARGEIEIGIAMGGGGAFDRLCKAVVSADWENACKLYAELAPDLRESAETLLLYAAAIAATASVAEARPLVDRAAMALFMTGDALNPCFWGAFNVLPPDEALRATVICTVALGVVKRAATSAFPLVESMIIDIAEKVAALRVSPEILWPVLEALIERRETLNARQLQTVCEHMAALAELVDDRRKAALARDVAARAAFARGHADQALSHQKRSADHLGVSQDRLRSSIWSARQIDVRVLALDPSAQLERLDAETWVAALGEARVVSGRVCGGSFHYVCTQDGNVIKQSLDADSARVIGSDRSPFRAQSPLGDLLVDLSARPQPWRMLEPAVLIGGDPDDDIWMLQHLPKIDIWRRAEMSHATEPVFFTDHQPSRRQREILKGLGLVDKNVVQSDPYYDRVFDKLYVPSWPSLKSAVDFLRKHFLTAEVGGTDLVYIHSASDMDLMSEQAGLAPAMIELGAKVLFLEQRITEDIARTLAAAPVVVRWSGPGAAFLAFCSPGASVIEIINPHRDTADQSDAILRCVGAKLERIAPPSESNRRGVPRVDMRALLRCLDEARGGLGEGRH
jgi:hypothetical protein